MYFYINALAYEYVEMCMFFLLHSIFQINTI